MPGRGRVRRESLFASLFARPSVLLFACLPTGLQACRCPAAVRVYRSACIHPLRRTSCRYPPDRNGLSMRTSGLALMLGCAAMLASCGGSGGSGGTAAPTPAPTSGAATPSPTPTPAQRAMLALRAAGFRAGAGAGRLSVPRPGRHQREQGQLHRCAGLPRRAARPGAGAVQGPLLQLSHLDRGRERLLQQRLVGRLRLPPDLRHRQPDRLCRRGVRGHGGAGQRHRPRQRDPGDPGAGRPFADGRLAVHAGRHRGGARGARAERCGPHPRADLPRSRRRDPHGQPDQDRLRARSGVQPLRRQDHQR